MKHGPQPFEGVVSVICEAFGCTPAEALRQDWPLVEAVLDYRAAERAAALLASEGGDELLAQQPALQRLLLDMRRAQNQATEAIE